VLPSPVNCALLLLLLLPLLLNISIMLAFDDGLALCVADSIDPIVPTDHRRPAPRSVPIEAPAGEAGEAGPSTLAKLPPRYALRSEELFESESGSAPIASREGIVATSGSPSVSSESREPAPTALGGIESTA